MRFHVTLSATVLLALCNFASAQETIDNPEFASWSKFKKGTSITYKSATKVGDIVAEATSTITLIEVAANKLVLETTTVTRSTVPSFRTTWTARPLSTNTDPARTL